MALKSLFPDEMMESKGSSSLTLETIAGKLSFFYEQLHLLHFQTTSFAEHSALGTIYDKVGDFQDEIVEKIMGYTGKRVRAYKIDALKDYTSGMPNQVVRELVTFAKDLEEFGEANNMPDIENIAQSLSGEASQTLYRLTLS
jgi:DNA-binding ferritin-like protein